jgi:hypothetical protein
MIAAKPSTHEGPRRAFFVERHLSPEEALDFGRFDSPHRLCVHVEHCDAGVPYLYSADLPTGDICLCLFRQRRPMPRRRKQPGALALDRVADAAPLL